MDCVGDCWIDCWDQIRLEVVKIQTSTSGGTLSQFLYNARKKRWRRLQGGAKIPRWGMLLNHTRSQESEAKRIWKKPLGRCTGIVDMRYVYDTAVEMVRFTIPQPQPMPCSILWAVLVVVLSAWFNKECTRQQLGLEAELYGSECLNVCDSLILNK